MGLLSRILIENSLFIGFPPAVTFGIEAEVGVEGKSGCDMRKSQSRIWVAQEYTDFYLAARKKI